MKYSITIDNSVIEFADMESASEYANKNQVSTGSIVEVSDDVVSPGSSSIEIFEQKIAEGYPVPNTSYRLGLKDSDRAQFSSMLTLVRELLDGGHITDETPQSIKDQNDNIITLTTEEFRSLMIGYGIYYKTIWNECEPKS